jgi:hypothetical protein
MSPEARGDGRGAADMMAGREPVEPLEDLGESNPWVSFAVLVGGGVALGVGFALRSFVPGGVILEVGDALFFGGIFLWVLWLIWARFSPQVLRDLVESLRLLRSRYRGRKDRLNDSERPLSSWK